MMGYFDLTLLTPYLNLCHLIQEESRKIYDDIPVANAQAAVAVSGAEVVGLARLMIDKGLITPEEYTLAIIDGLQVKLEALQKLSQEQSKRKRWYLGFFND